MKKTILASLLCLPCPAAFGAWALVDNFEGAEPLSNWTLSGNTAGGRTITVAESPETGVTGNVLRIYSGTAAADMFAFRNLPESIANSSTAATLYFRMFVSTATRNAVGGLAEAISPTAYSNYAAVARLMGDNLDVYNGNTTGGGATTNGAYQPVDTSAQSGVWYDIWMVVNNAADTYQVWYSEDGGPQTLGTYAGGDTFTFRQGGADPVARFMAATSSPAGTVSYFDDIYLDTSGQNLTLPIPEPATLALGALGAIGLLRRRR